MPSALEPHAQHCPLCGGPLAPDGGPDAPGRLGAFALMHCPACLHSCCPAAYNIPADYEALYAADYVEEQIEPLGDSSRHFLLTLLTPYLAFFNNCGRGRGRSLLDIGCGTGRFLIAAEGRGWRVRGIEPAQSAVEIARPLGLAISQETAEELAESGERFDAVTLFDVIEHVPSPRALLGAAISLLRPGGDLFISVPNWDCPLMREATRAEWIPPVHLQFFSLDSLLRCAKFALLESRQPLHIRGAGLVWIDPRPPLAFSFAGRPHLLPRHWLRWAWHRLRRRPNIAPQLWLHARMESKE